MLKVSVQKPIDIEMVRSAYSGHPSKCRCGCSGKYFYTKAHQVEASQNRGYEVGDDEVNDRQVAKMVKTINDAIASPTEVVEVMLPSSVRDDELIYDYKLSDTRTYTLYVKISK